MPVAIVTSEKKSELKQLKRGAKNLSVHIMEDESIEDFLLGKLMEASVKEKGEKKLGDPLKFLRAHGCKIYQTKSSFRNIEVTNHKSQSR